jgi:phosphoribosylamine--glycine ligase
MGINLLLLGSGGREHALAWKLAHSTATANLYCAPGNAGTESIATNIDFDIIDPSTVRQWSEEHAIDLVIVGPEDPLASGVGDELRAVGIPCLGPNKGAARIETSKIWAKHLMVKAGIPTAQYRVFEDENTALTYLAQVEYPAVIKADGLALGKGVMIADNFASAKKAVQNIMTDRMFGDAGSQILVEECLIGEELSAFAITDGQTFKMLPFARDYKRIADGDLGPNTGGMGSYSPVAIADEKLGKEVENSIFEPILRALAESGNVYQGFLFAGLMLTTDGIKVIEFNARLGDPETQVILPLFDGDFADIAYLAAVGKLKKAQFEIASGAACCVVMSSGGYPLDYKTGYPIHGLNHPHQNTLLFQAGMTTCNGQLVTNGGRVLSVVGLGDSLSQARTNAYASINNVSFKDAYHRKDIGTDNPARSRSKRKATQL